MPRVAWTWTFDLPPADLWPLLADTNRFNEAMGLPAYALEETPQPDGTVLRRGRGTAAGFKLEWEEKPYEWTWGRHFRQARVFSRGPFRRFGPVFDLEPTTLSDGRTGSLVRYALEYEPLTLLGRLFGARLARQAGSVVGRRILEAVAFAKGARATVFELPPPVLPAGARERAASLAAEIDRSPYGNGLGRPLAELVLTGMATDLTQIRPKRLASRLGVPTRLAVEACLAATRSGLLAMKWDLLCPNCRGPKASTPTLSELPRGAHCASCNIDYERDFERNVELSFAAAPSLRPLASGAFCLSGPMATPHVALQVLLAPGETRTVSAALAAGAWRLRTLNPGEAVDLDHEGGAFPGLRVTAQGVETLSPGEPGTITVRNDSGGERAVLIEDRSWTRDALTAPEVITLQAFRDLFGSATLRPGDEAGVGQVALLFSDLQGSTALYERVGDAAAYSVVREHFALLAGIVRDHDGAVVKTIGDAVMAAFDDPARAVQAALAMQMRIADHKLVLKLGIHAGPSVVVTLNDRLDYFGSTVNLAARLQGEARGGDLVLSRAVAEDPGVRPLLAGHLLQAESLALKGFAASVGFVRLTT
ncbi:MAG: adenylate/guanylate cyclase domain-containing protein [Reyranellaceae bacterium]